MKAFDGAALAVPATILHWVSRYGYVGLFSLFMLGIFGVPVPEESLLALAGVLAGRGQLRLVPAILVIYAGSLCGMAVNYTLGRTVGTRFVRRYGRVLRVSEATLDRVEQWFERGGRWTLFFGYFLPGVRHLTAILAGSSRVKLSIFASFAAAGGFVWSTSFVLLGYYLGGNWEVVVERIQRHLVTGTLVLALVAALLLLRRWRIWRRAERRVGSGTPAPRDESRPV
jgi:membrane protein DedA with SNARE-associated domain